MIRRLPIRQAKVGQRLRLADGRVYQVTAYVHEDVFARRAYGDGNDGWRLDYKSGPELIPGSTEGELC